MSLRNGVCVNRSEIDFNTDLDEIPICEETRQLLCIGNNSERTMKVQMSVSSNEQKFLIRTNPPVVTLKRGFACEFEIFVKPNYTTKFCSKAKIVSKSLQSGVETINEITIKGVTQISTRLDPDELIEEKKIGEGGFGVVYKGTYRGNVVAIKKMRDYKDSTELLLEFENEIYMLDKFRSEYIVHFYGAVFIPNKICMVTEFAQYGSLKDLMNHKKTNEIDEKIKLKMILDAAKGILYLHENGILHRDIKPDNILVISLDLNDKVNAKLTDFGSSRNVNLLMTNMTFTKGIGTPVFMAPEVLNQEKYKQAADVYSFAISMYECFVWGNAYPKEKFNFPWKIAEFVNEGNRLQNPGTIKSEIYTLICMCWQQEPKNRIPIKVVVEKLEKVI
ncbi:serine/threonine protein kinase HT1, putative [Entamoeba invadens IP1]|uniref:Serine/threonine protein kinase HT1, putative n=1 Tax=Entamoeba invadens IP1 TaxID=370355 RepID=L7FL29_ENTIV|nr:serine/threonine protein kinase HT1, putative [Entamoeba invadens IP1]ELP87586.1 serine/threonine protein kinase HT1, putative [Entamoeba invadens IP1]|eukprot:XP_004254357.1 serine/threonine protein kinase HT1, putative [Entamoeba invadens IP1]